MTNFNLGSVAERAYNGLNDVPTAISGAVMVEIAYQSLLFVNNYLGVAIGSNAISDAYQSPMINLTKAWTLARMAGVGTDFSWALGEFRVEKSSNNPDIVLIKTFFETATLELDCTGKSFVWAKANG